MFQDVIQDIRTDGKIFFSLTLEILKVICSFINVTKAVYSAISYFKEKIFKIILTISNFMSNVTGRAREMLQTEDYRRQSRLFIRSGALKGIRRFLPKEADTVSLYRQVLPPALILAGLERLMFAAASLTDSATRCLRVTRRSGPCSGHRYVGLWCPGEIGNARLSFDPLSYRPQRKTPSLASQPLSVLKSSH